MRNKKAFTLMELIFVIVIMGLLSKYGVEFITQAYRSFMYSKINNDLESNSAIAVEFIAKRLQYRIKSSTIARTGKTTDFDAIGDINTSKSYTVLEWISTDAEGFRGKDKPYWSSIVDADLSDKDKLISPQTETNTTDNLIDILSYGLSSIDDASIYFLDSLTNINGYGWDGNALVDQNTSSIHPIKQDVTFIDRLLPRKGGTTISNDFKGTKISEYYKLSWTANAVVIQNYDPVRKMGDLVFYYNYQPWDGEIFYNDANSSIIMKNVSTFQFLSVGSVMKIQVCTKSDLIADEEYSICKEKTIY
jgi:prepilin-type N-terminal cleavage/methylation domain-containing protein